MALVSSQPKKSYLLELPSTKWAINKVLHHYNLIINVRLESSMIPYARRLPNAWMCDFTGYVTEGEKNLRILETGQSKRCQLPYQVSSNPTPYCHAA